MKIKYFFQILFLAILMISCSRDEAPENILQNDPLITKIATAVLYPGALPFNNAEMMFYYEYDGNQRLTKKICGLIYTSGSTGNSSGYFTDKIQTSLKYENDKVTVEDFSTTPDFTVPKNTKYFKLNSSKQIVEKEIPDVLSNYRYKKEFFYYKNNRIDEIKTTLPNAQYDPTDPNDYIETYSEKFYYNSAGNLEKTEYFELHNGANTENKRVRYFENYDNSSNPFKRFTLIDDCFYRSLSKNNYRSYKEVKTWYGLTNVTQQEWDFAYDANGQIIIN